MTELTIDVPRLRKELEYITAHRAQWQQGTWIHRTACGTTGCLAGNVVMNAGYRPVFTGSKHTLTAYVVAGTAASYAVEQHVADVAADVLGLNDEQANKLFSSQNSLYVMWKLASEFTNGEIEIPASVEDEVHGRVQAPPSGYQVVDLNDRQRRVLRLRQHERQHRAVLAELERP